MEDENSFLTLFTKSKNTSRYPFATSIQINLVPELVSNLEFAGKEGNILYVTATTSLYKMELNQIGAKF